MTQYRPVRDNLAHVPTTESVRESYADSWHEWVEQGEDS